MLLLLRGPRNETRSPTQYALRRAQLGTHPGWPLNLMPLCWHPRSPPFTPGYLGRTRNPSLPVPAPIMLSCTISGFSLRTSPQRRPGITSCVPLYRDTSWISYSLHRRFPSSSQSPPQPAPQLPPVSPASCFIHEEVLSSAELLLISVPGQNLCRATLIVKGGVTVDAVIPHMDPVKCQLM
ncbi:hypothetical protein DPEC_G00320720 [Dallia pectoralis]|uniref:Uncharacterized protein n=1 Tax=Dallia pectoralis TaxID=75939 RepID=A0ACC2FA00_DALPE|nr:hypothetical protein DPEC_G00320720 [Dallia pectoralis]